jgi:hypothetical protein
VNRRQIHSIEEVNALAERIEKASHASFVDRRS